MGQRAPLRLLRGRRGPRRWKPSGASTRWAGATTGNVPATSASRARRRRAERSRPIAATSTRRSRCGRPRARWYLRLLRRERLALHAAAKGIPLSPSSPTPISGARPPRRRRSGSYPPSLDRLDGLCADPRPSPCGRCPRRPRPRSDRDPVRHAAAAARRRRGSRRRAGRVRGRATRHLRARLAQVAQGSQGRRGFMTSSSRKMRCASAASAFGEPACFGSAPAGSAPVSRRASALPCDVEEVNSNSRARPPCPRHHAAGAAPGHERVEGAGLALRQLGR